MLEQIRSYTCYELLSPLPQFQTWNITCVNYITFSFIRRNIKILKSNCLEQNIKKLHYFLLLQRNAR